MITGVVTPDREASVQLTVHSATGLETMIAAVIDTGFDGSLSLTSAVISSLGLPWRGRGRALLADGSESVFDIFEATVDWDGQRRRVAVDQVETLPLIGMALLEGYELTIQVRASGSVSIRPLP
ncbi:MAG: clan AA aspartic protease [Planctomycetes bacterium]|nr:clan AA aspartic protease [Planctomycetota bacterium]